MTMKKNILVLVCFGIFLLLPSVVLADCDDLGGYSNFLLQGSNTVVLYAGSTPMGQFDVQSCNVTPTSTILLIKSMVCDGDDVMIDGSRCTVMNVKSLN
jgi:hypothetical protein